MHLELELLHAHAHVHKQKLPTYEPVHPFHHPPQTSHHAPYGLRLKKFPNLALECSRNRTLPFSGRKSRSYAVSASHSPLDLTEDNIKQVLADARVELAQLFDESVGITGKTELAELDGPHVKISLSGKFWHKRSTVLARLGNYLKQRIPEILEVDIEDEKQLDDSPANF